MLLVKTYIGPSRIHGIGLFADQCIPAGTRYWEVTPGIDIWVSRKIVDQQPAPARDQLLTYSFMDMHSGALIVCMDQARHTNHSNEPNTREIHRPDAYAYAIVTKDIVWGEEITCDYRTFDASWREKLGADWPDLPKVRSRRKAA